MIDLAAGAVFGGAAATIGLLWSAPAVEPVRPVTEAPAPWSRSFEARALGVVDGDTFEARIASFPGHEVVARIRIAGVDAPEKRGRCGSETAAAEAATEALERLLEGRRLTLTEVKGDKYFGRVVARVSAADVGDLAGALVAGGHGRVYAGGKRAGWCG